MGLRICTFTELPIFPIDSQTHREPMVPVDSQGFPWSHKAPHGPRGLTRLPVVPKNTRATELLAQK